MPLSNYTKQWFAKGDEDLAVVWALLEKGISPSLICFHCEQAAEKYLKGFLASHEKNLRKTHSLQALVSLCTELDPSFQELSEDALALDDFYIDTRYPDTALDLSLEQAKNSAALAEKFKDFVMGKVELRTSF